ncbi:MAG: peptidase M20 [Alphaproteobacteria bacterium]|nr:peptidase M20 [Alphaproteobacteria bacterium]|tara:strand:- start:361 stop:1533 length:1173 start_codon:yes stop_codon:yes gene_type:complete
MAIIERINEINAEMIEWRQDIHSYPELAFEEYRTAKIVTEKLKEFGIDTETEIAKTGVVGTLEGKSEGSSIAIRADMDALALNEETGLDYASKNQGKMHACGHDGHTAMLLGAAKYLSETRNFSGKVHFIFQPAEEGAGGAKVMIDEGLFKKYPVDGIFGLHNWPGLPLGQFAVIDGPIMAAADFFEVTVTGNGAHGAMPHLGSDPIVCSSQIINALQTIVSRNLDPLEAGVLTVTKVHGGEANNVIPEKVVFSGTARAFQEQIRDQLESRLTDISVNIAEANGCSANVLYERNYPPTVNASSETEIASKVAGLVVGNKNVRRDLSPCMGSEDFAFMLQEIPGCYIWMGNGDQDGGCFLHNPGYDFNDQALTIGASYWVRLVEELLPVSK